MHHEFYKGKNQLVALTVRKDGAITTEIRTIKLVIGQAERVAIPGPNSNLAFMPGGNST
jgi:hypothetical protein